MSSDDLDLLNDSATDHPLWIDSACFYLSVPELRLHGFIFYFFRPNLNLLTGGPVIWDTSGHTALDCLHYNFSQYQPIPDAAQKFNFEAANSLRVTTLDPKNRYQLTYNYGGLEFELNWQATMPLHNAPQRDPTSYHAEQAGRMTGWLNIEGRKIAVDCASLRDISYGVRDYSGIKPGMYCWGSTGSSMFQALCMGMESEKNILTGFVHKDKQTSSLIEGTYRVDEFGPYGARNITIEGIDALGRPLQVQGKLDDGLLFNGNSTHTVVWSLTEWKWDGKTCWGDNQEFYPAATFRRIARGDKPYVN